VVTPAAPATRAAPPTLAAPAAPHRRDRPINTAVVADDDTITSAKHGDPAAWRALYTDHAGRLVVWLRSLPCRDPGIAPEDLAAETWLTAATKIADFKGTSDDFAGWLFGIARMQRRNAERRTARRRTTPAAPHTLEMNATHHTPAAGTTPETDHWVAWLLAHLPERERQVIACIEVVGLDVATTAAALRLSAGNVRVVHCRALKRLRALGAQLT
jgi:RNA polymerase sigma-70 factor (ECF subfamily)